jgi:hypothetical protein
MAYFTVSSVDFAVRNKKGEDIELTPDHILKKIKNDKENGIDFKNPKKGETVTVFTADDEAQALEIAKKVAAHGVDKDDNEQFLILELELKPKSKLKETEHELLDENNEEVEDTVDAFITPATNVVSVIRARFDHFDEKRAPVEFAAKKKDLSADESADSDKPDADKPDAGKPDAGKDKPASTNKIIAWLKSWAPSALTSGALAGGLHYMGTPALAADLLAKLGVVLPLSPALAQGALAIAGGVALYAAGIGAKMALSWAKTKWEYFRKTAQEKYGINVPALKDKVAELAKKNGLDETSPVYGKLMGILDAARTMQFDDKGVAKKADEQPKVERSATLTHMADFLSKRAAAKPEAQAEMDKAVLKKGFKLGA